METYDYSESRNNLLKNQIISNLQKAELLESNRQLLLQYAQELIANGLKATSLGNRVHPVKKLAIFLKKDFKEATKEDIVRFIGTLNHLSWRVINTYRYRIKNFYHWLNRQEGKKDLPESVSWIEITTKSKTEKPKEILTKEEIKKLVEYADHPREKAIIVLLADSGCRVGEICNLKLKDVFFDEFGALIDVKGKTGERQIRLIDSVPNLRAWINGHPFKDNPEAPLFFGKRRCFGEPLGHLGIWNGLREVAARAGIKKNVHPHIFRHTKLTEMAKLLTDAELRIFSGWTKSSPMAAVYIHLNSNDVNHKILEKRGLISLQDRRDERLIEPAKCIRCSNLNPIENTICEFCNQVLDPKAAFHLNNNLAEENKKLNERLNVIEDVLKQMVQHGTQTIPLGNQQAMISASGLQWSDQFIEFKKERKEKEVY